MKVQNLSHSVHATIVGVRARQTGGNEGKFVHRKLEYPSALYHVTWIAMLNDIYAKTIRSRSK